MARGMYWTCEYGSNHDHGERCYCKEELERERKHVERLLVKEGDSNQLTFNWDKEMANA